MVLFSYFPGRQSNVLVHSSNTEPFWKSPERREVKEDSRSGRGKLSTALKRNVTAFSWAPGIKGGNVERGKLDFRGCASVHMP